MYAHLYALFSHDFYTQLTLLIFWFHLRTLYPNNAPRPVNKRYGTEIKKSARTPNTTGVLVLSKTWLPIGCELTAKLF